MPALYSTLPEGNYIGQQTTIVTISPDVSRANVKVLFDGDTFATDAGEVTNNTSVTVVMNRIGQYIVYVIPTLMANGTIPDGINMSFEMGSYVYKIQVAELLTVISHNPVTGLDEVNGGIIYANDAGEPSCRIKLNVGNIPVVQGSMTKNGKRVGEFCNQDNLTVEYWYTNGISSMPVRNGDLIEIQVNVPSYSIQSFIVKRNEMPPPKGISVSSVFKEASAANFFGGATYVNPAIASKLLLDTINKDIPLTYKVKPNVNMPSYLKLLSNFTNNRFQRGALNADIYKTTAAALNAVANAFVGPNRPIIDAATNTVYGFLGGVIKAIPNLKAQDFFGAPRLVDSYVEAGPIATYLIDVDNRIKLQ